MIKDSTCSEIDSLNFFEINCTFYECKAIG